MKAAEAAVNISVPAAAAAVGESISSNLITDRRDILLRINTKEKIVYIKLSYINCCSYGSLSELALASF